MPEAEAEAGKVVTGAEGAPDPAPVVEAPEAPETTTDSKQPELSPFAQRLAAGVHLGINREVGYGRFTPNGTTVDVQTGELTPPVQDEVKKPDNESTPAPGSEEDQEKKAPKSADPKSPIGRLKAYVARLERETAAE